MGSPELAVPSLRALAAQTTVAQVITQPDRPAGRGKRLRPPPVKEAALELGIPVWQPERLRDHAEDPRLSGFDLFVVLAYGEILTEALLARPRACINVHASLLPAWRGASPLQAAIRAGDQRGGVSIMRMVRQLDAGPVYLQEAVDLPPWIDLPRWHDRVATLSVRALMRFLEAWPAITAEPQDEAQASYCGKLGSADGQLDWRLPARALERQVRAYSPVPGCWLQMGGARYRIEQVALDHRHNLAPGHWYWAQGQAWLGCGAEALEVRRIQAPGKRALPMDAFLNGHTLPPSCDPLD